MQTFPNLLTEYAAANNIKLNQKEKLRIYSCFQPAEVSISRGTFENFAFRHGDRALLLYVLKLSGAKINCEDPYVEKDYSFLKFCNPNAEISTVTTTVGKFYGANDDYTCEKSNETLESTAILISKNIFFYN